MTLLGWFDTINDYFKQRFIFLLMKTLSKIILSIDIFYLEHSFDKYDIFQNFYVSLKTKKNTLLKNIGIYTVESGSAML